MGLRAGLHAMANIEMSLPVAHLSCQSHSLSLPQFIKGIIRV